MTAVLLVLVSVFCFGFFLWGQTGGLVASMPQRMTAAEAAIRATLGAEAFTVEQVVCAWPRIPGSGPGAALALNRSAGRLAYVEIQRDRSS